MDISEIGYIDEIRQRLGLEKGDTSKDSLIEKMPPFERVRLICGWYHGDEEWADTFKEYLESQGLYITDNPHACGILWD